MAGYDELRREQAEKRAARRADGHRHLRSSPRGSAPARASTWTSSAWAWPTAASCGCTRPARRSCGSRCRPRARATRRRSRRSSRRSSACRRRTSRSSTATPTTRRSGWAPTGPARRRCPARRPPWWRNGPREGADHRRRRARGQRRRPRVGARAAGRSRATRSRARRSRRSPCSATAAWSCPRASRAIWTRRSSTTRRT